MSAKIILTADQWHEVCHSALMLTLTNAELLSKLAEIQHDVGEVVKLNATLQSRLSAICKEKWEAEMSAIYRSALRPPMLP
jgi:hypothetical protein